MPNFGTICSPEIWDVLYMVLEQVYLSNTQTYMVANYNWIYKLFKGNQWPKCKSYFLHLANLADSSLNLASWSLKSVGVLYNQALSLPVWLQFCNVAVLKSEQNRRCSIYTQRHAYSSLMSTVAINSGQINFRNLTFFKDKLSLPISWLITMKAPSL